MRMFYVLFVFFLSYLYLPGQTTTVELSGCKFYDINCNGVWDAGEPTIGGWPIVITDANGNAITITTNADGCWSYDVQVVPGTAAFYTITEGLLPGGWFQSFPASGLYSIQVVSGQPVSGLDFGNCFDGFPLTLSGCKFHDLDCDGVWDSNEPTIPGWPIVITDQTNGLTYNLTTDVQGCYHLTLPAVSPGAGVITYQISEGMQAGWMQTYPASGTYTVQQDGGVVSGLDFGNCDGEPPTETMLSGCKFHDLDCDGIWDANEPSLPNWPIYITDVNGNIIDTVYTNADGCWSANVPAPGVYEVSEGTLSPYWHQTYPPGGFYLLNVAPNQPIGGLDFGNNESHLIITACKFHDIDCDGQYNPDVDTLLPNWPILIETYIPPTDSNGVGISYLDTVYTGEFGCYIFNLPPGAIYSFSEPDVPGWIPTLPLDFEWDFTNPCGSLDIHAYFGNMQPQPYLVTVCKAHDMDCDGQYDPNVDTLLPNWPIVLETTLVDGNVNLSFLDTFYTDDSGCVGFELYPGNKYVITEADVPGWMPSANNHLEFDFVDNPPNCVPIPIDPAQLFLNCNQPPPVDSCGAIVDDVLEFSCDEDGFHYTYTFFLQNNSSDAVTSFLLNNFPGNPDYFSNNNYPGSFPIPPGGIGGPFTTTVSLPIPIPEPDTACFTVTLITDGGICCHFEHCLEVVPEDPCESVVVEVTPIDPVVNEPGTVPNDCCYEVNLFNDFCPNYFTGVSLEIQTPGVIFSGYTMGSSLWDVQPVGPTVLMANYIGGINGNGFLPVGASGPFYFCINTDQYNGNGPIQILLSWLIINPVTGEIVGVCEELIEVECSPPCLIATGYEEVLCLDNGNYLVPNLCVSNNTNNAATVVLLEIQSPAGAVIFPDQFNYVGNPSCSPVEIGGVSVGDTVTIKVLLLDEASGWCCHVFVHILIPECGNLCIDPGQIDSTVLCIDQYEPVCGCDGVTYSNECYAFYYGGVTSWTPGACDQACIDQSLIDPNMACPTVYEPVCGCDGVTYTNSCIALYYYGVTSWTLGECPLIPNPELPILPPDQFNKEVFVLSAYPNPTNNKLYLELNPGSYQLQLFDARGQLLKKQRLQALKEEAPCIEVSGLRSGIYLLHVSGEQGRSYVLRFVKTGN